MVIIVVSVLEIFSNDQSSILVGRLVFQWAGRCGLVAMVIDSQETDSWPKSEKEDQFAMAKNQTSVSRANWTSFSLFVR